MSSRFDYCDDDLTLDPHLEGGGATLYNDDDMVDMEQQRLFDEYMQARQDEEDAMSEWELQETLRRECENRRGAFLLQIPDEDGDSSVPIRYASVSE